MRTRRSEGNGLPNLAQAEDSVSGDEIRSPPKKATKKKRYDFINKSFIFTVFFSSKIGRNDVGRMQPIRRITRSRNYAIVELPPSESEGESIGDLAPYSNNLQESLYYFLIYIIINLYYFI